jgi:hypothetical protein
VSFADAVDAAKRRMAEPGAVFCALDLRSARKLGVRPLPLRSDEEGIDTDALRTDAPATIAKGGLGAVELAERAERAGGSVDRRGG